MKLHLINEIIDTYSVYLASDEWRGNYIWDAIIRFQNNWDPGQSDFRRMLNQAISDNLQKRHWSDRPRRTKDVLMKFAEIDPQATKQMFHDLFYDRIALNSRITCFKQDCDVLMAPILHFVNTPFSRHYHEDYNAISVYLTLMYPDKYSFFDLSALTDFLQSVEARQIPDRTDFEKYHRILHVLGQIVTKNVGLVDRAQFKKLVDHKGEVLYPLQLVFDMIRFHSTGK